MISYLRSGVSVSLMLQSQVVERSNYGRLKDLHISLKFISIMQEKINLRQVVSLYGSINTFG